MIHKNNIEVAGITYEVVATEQMWNDFRLVEANETFKVLVEYKRYGVSFLVLFDPIYGRTFDAHKSKFKMK